MIDPFNFVLTCHSWILVYTAHRQTDVCFRLQILKFVLFHLKWLSIMKEIEAWMLHILTPANNHCLLCLTPRILAKQNEGREIIWMDRFSCASSVFEKALMSTPAAWLTATNLNSGNKTVFKRTFSLAERLKQRATFSQLWLTVYSKYKLFKNSNVIQTNWNWSFIMAGIYLYGFMISVDILQLTLADCRYVHMRTSNLSWSRINILL